MSVSALASSVGVGVGVGVLTADLRRVGSAVGAAVGTAALMTTPSTEPVRIVKDRRVADADVASTVPNEVGQERCDQGEAA